MIDCFLMSGTFSSVDSIKLQSLKFSFYLTGYSLLASFPCLSPIRLLNVAMTKDFAFCYLLLSIKASFLGNLILIHRFKYYTYTDDSWRNVFDPEHSPKFQGCRSNSLAKVSAWTSNSQLKPNIKLIKLNYFFQRCLLNLLLLAKSSSVY